MKKFKSLLSLVLSLVMLFNSGIPAFASTSESSISASSNVVVTDSGIYIGGVFYTQEEFVKLLEDAEEVKTRRPRADIAVQPDNFLKSFAGIFLIPGVGKVVITVAGVVIVGGAVIAAGTWVHNAVQNWFTSKNQEKEYEEAKEVGKPTNNHSTETDERYFRPEGGEPYSSKDLIKGGGVKRRRYYDKNGNADMDIDYYHNGDGHTFPHRHIWNGKKRILLQ